MTWLRWVTLEGQLLPSREELVIQAEHNLEPVKQRAIPAEQRAEQLATKLRALGMHPDV
jgi:hypothetical protein